MPIVKRFTAYVPDETGEIVKTKCKVTLNTKTSVFEVLIPEHIGDVVRGMNLPEWLTVNGHEAAPGDNQFRVVNRTIEDVQANFEFLARKYGEWLKDQKAVPFLKVIFRYNVRHVDGFHNHPDAPGFREFSSYNGGRPHKMHFSGTPSLELITTKVWKIDGTFYQANPRTPTKWVVDQDLRGRYDKVYTIPWTQEREDYLSRMDHALTTLICQLMVFFEDVEGNIDTAIEKGLSPLAIEKSANEGLT